MEIKMMAKAYLSILIPKVEHVKNINKQKNVNVKLTNKFKYSLNI